MATHLYIENLDPVSVHSLAGNAREIIDTLAANAGAHTFLDHVKATVENMTDQRYYRAANVYRNAMKHADNRDDTDVISQFTDEANRHLLFVNWYNYGNLSGQLPIEARVFESWYFAIDPERSSDPESAVAERQYFGDLSDLKTSERKRRLKRAIKASRSMSDMMSDSRTELEPLVYKNDL